MSYPATLITANGTTKLSLAPGEYALMLAGNFGGGTLSARWKVDDSPSVEYPNGSFTAAGGIVIAVGGRVDLVLSGATSPAIDVSVMPISLAE